MTHRFIFVLSAALLLAGLATADKKESATISKVPRAADGHPDLSASGPMPSICPL